MLGNSVSGHPKGLLAGNVAHVWRLPWEHVCSIIDRPRAGGLYRSQEPPAKTLGLKNSAETGLPDGEWGGGRLSGVGLLAPDRQTVSVLR